MAIWGTAAPGQEDEDQVQQGQQHRAREADHAQDQEGVTQPLTVWQEIIRVKQPASRMMPRMPVAIPTVRSSAAAATRAFT